MCERPYEKCLEYGTQVLSDTELIAVILRSGTKNNNSIELARQIMFLSRTHEGILGLNHVSLKELKSINGIGTVKAIQLLCVAELSKRMSAATAKEKICFNSPNSISDYYMEKLRHLQQETIWLLLLNTKHQLISDICISKGTVNSSVITPRELFIEALKYEAVNIILLHNHPSGDPTPSNNDISFTNRISKSGSILGIFLSDHIIIGDNKFYSFRENGNL